MQDKSSNDATNLYLISANQIISRNLGRVIGAKGYKIQEISQSDLFEVAETPLAVVIDLGIEDILEAVTRYKKKWPKALIAGFVSLPDPDKWLASEKAGCDLVATRGAFPHQFLQRLTAWEQQPGGRRIRILNTGDVAGRLGVVKHIEDSPVGPIAIYHIGGDLYAAQDVCPHAGAKLSGGELHMGKKMITCPKHGSQFNVSDGERMRGPADYNLKTYKIVVEGSQVFLQLD
ncbi:MAG: Rieske 2Fe-2S domain-containing protein [Chloroflexota bacterium]